MISFGDVLAGTVGLVFVLAAVGKLRSRASINVVVRSLLPAALTIWSRQLALVLIMVELLIGICCASPALRVPASVLASLMALGFTLLATGTALGLMAVDCACFGGPRRRLGWPDVARDLVLLIIATTLWIAPSVTATPLRGWTLLVVGVLGLLTVAVIVGLGHRTPRPAPARTTSLTPAERVAP